MSQKYVHTVYMRYFWQGNQQKYGHIRCVHIYGSGQPNKQQYKTPSLNALIISSNHRKLFIALQLFYCNAIHGQLQDSYTNSAFYAVTHTHTHNRTHIPNTCTICH